VAKSTSSSIADYFVKEFTCPPTSFMKSTVTTKPLSGTIAVTIQGRKYGYEWKKGILPIVSGHLSAGCDSIPPITGLG
jgi:hypothetical protein